jgi:hypothetical protein
VASQFSNALALLDQEAQAVLRDRARHIRADRANSAVVRTQQARRGPVVIRLVLEWVE